MIIISDNQPLTRDALTNYLVGQPLRFARNKTELVERLTIVNGGHASVKEDGEKALILVILDFSLFDFTTPENFLIYVRRFPQVRWLLLSSEYTEGLLRMFGSEQTVNFMMKDCNKEDVLHAIYMIQHQGDRVVCPYVSEQLTHGFCQRSDVHLTPTETAILSLIAQGLSAKAIAEKRHSSVHTIITHKKNIFRKIGVSTAYEATRYALRSGITDPVEYYI